ncbi:hypothetical protein [Mesonia aquimarina]|uniref:hypothetical protein n=1 Tax=Mesonia aquimarina TaxID=1504967 RepID=UPI000EF60ABE|nr:hypothetical protein [Mesonia aquimarina]
MDNENRPKPFSKERTKATICKVIFFYSVFYVVMKVIAAFKGMAVIPNLILSLPYLIFAIIGLWMTRNNKFSWWYVILGVLLVSFMRYYEFTFMQYLQKTL